ncbi:hypothetical protein HMPREF1992_01435 [Selenomonas sp. oral taxon 892 str. F0426]|nr:hypothetical protein HMPREF1992_01435 [Selenomonas sp. oral taxon 892 str. F0426]
MRIRLISIGRCRINPFLQELRAVQRIHNRDISRGGASCPSLLPMSCPIRR